MVGRDIGMIVAVAAGALMTYIVRSERKKKRTFGYKLGLGDISQYKHIDSVDVLNKVSKQPSLFKLV